MQIRRAVVAAVLVLPAFAACGSTEQFAFDRPCEALTEKDIGAATGLAVKEMTSSVIDPTVFVCEWVPIGINDFLVRLRMQSGAKILEADRNRTKVEELPELGDGGFTVVSLDGKRQTIDASRGGRSMSVECELARATWTDKGCQGLAELVVDRMPD